MVTFSRGWPLSADAWDAQMLFLGQKGCRVIAHDRRGRGRSGQPWQGNNMDQYAEDLAELMKHLDLKEPRGSAIPPARVRSYASSGGTGRSALPRFEIPIRFTRTPVPRVSSRVSCGAVLRRSRLPGVWLSSRFRIPRRSVLAALLLSPAYPVRLSALSRRRCSGTCRPGRSHCERQKRSTTSPAVNNGPPTYWADSLCMRTKRVFLAQERHQFWPRKFRRHRNTPRSGPWR